MKFEKIHWFESLESTNRHLAVMLEEKSSLKSGTVIAARQQTKGLGRDNRHWISTSNKDLAFSFFLNLAIPEQALLSLPLVTGLAVSQVLDSINIKNHLKWPNDVLVNGAKICGILSHQVQSHHDELVAAIVGIGLNVNMNQDQADQIDQLATSVFIESGQEHEVDLLLDAIIHQLEIVIPIWQLSGFRQFRASWLERFSQLGKLVTIRNQRGLFEGVAKDIGENGELILQDSQGNLQSIWAGDLLVQ